MTTLSSVGDAWRRAAFDDSVDYAVCAAAWGMWEDGVLLTAEALADRVSHLVGDDCTGEDAEGMLAASVLRLRFQKRWPPLTWGYLWQTRRIATRTGWDAVVTASWGARAGVWWGLATVLVLHG